MSAGVNASWSSIRVVLFPCSRLDETRYGIESQRLLWSMAAWRSVKTSVAQV